MKWRGKFRYGFMKFSGTYIKQKASHQNDDLLFATHKTTMEGRKQYETFRARTMYHTLHYLSTKTFFEKGVPPLRLGKERNGGVETDRQKGGL